ncbi:hypothetical protein MKW92_023406 [Papaver armeniacum]|nr:hypothetical protein MKW92_023406 [Papaver armeniacum]
MGGGGVMRTAAAKIASFSFRGTPSLVPAENQESKIKSLSSITRRPSWEIDDWDFADQEEEPEVLLSDSIQNMPSRVIFGGVPSLEEAEEATSELKVALDDMTSSLDYEYEYESETSETKACVTTTSEDPITIPSESGPILQAFSLLKESPAAQSVVSSLACDENVWDAVMGNEKVMEFLKLHQTDNEYHEHKKLSMCFEDIKQTEGLGNMFSKTLDNFKLKVLEMMTSLSTLFQDLFGGQASGSNIHLDANGNARATIVDRIKGSSFMALAIMVIMVVILKRR